jgi:hypothetical protein
MTPAEAAKLLELPANATPEQIEARFLDLRRKLEDKIAKAPTPGLQSKYRESLTEITAAFETLTLAADSSALPVLKKEAGDRRPETGGSAYPRAGSDPSHQSQVSNHPPAKRTKSGGREFVVVALIAVLVLGAGGWWVMKTRAEKAEQARIAAEAKAEADRKAAEAKAEADRRAAEEKRIAEEKKRAEEEEKARLAAAAKAEQERLDRLTGQLRGELAGFKVRWEALEKEERNAERRLSELKSDLRSLRDPQPGVLAEAQALAAAQQEFYDWLSGTLARHPARIARSKAEELLAARQPDEAAKVMDELRAGFAELEAEVPRQRNVMTSVRGALSLITAADATWTITDAFGQTRSGEGSARIEGLAVGRARLQLRKPLWPDRDFSVTIRNETDAEFSSAYQTKGVDLASEPAGATVMGPDGRAIGRTPLRVELPPGDWPVVLKLDGYVERKITLNADTGSPAPLALRVKPKGLVKPESWSSPSRVRVETRSILSGTSNSDSQGVEEWELARPDGHGGWQQVTRRLVSRTGFDRAYVPADGSVMRQTLQPDGKWTGNFTQGGLPDANLNSIWTSTSPSVWLVSLGSLDVWPATEVDVGGTWRVKPEVFFPMIGLMTATGQVTGRLLEITADAGWEVAVVEFSYSYIFSGMNGQASIRMHVNLGEDYVTRAEGQDAISGQYATKSSYTITVTKR